MRGAGLPPAEVLTNASWLDGAQLSGRPLSVTRLAAEGLRLRQLALLALGRYDAVLLNIEARWLYLACLAKKLLPFLRCRILSVDLVLTRPRGPRERLRHVLQRWLLREVDRFLFYFRDTREVERVFSLPPERIRYVPFKVNTLEKVLATPVSDEGFFLACGRSNRDYATLCAAFRELPYRCFILAPWGATEEHGTRLEGQVCPPNVTLISDDGSPDSWNRWIARARAVVLPIEPGNLSPSGIGTYLVAMALGKCVVITRSVATEGLLTDRIAALVPPRDVEALREAVRRVAEDGAYRRTVAEAGRRYALSLGGEERLRRDVVRELDELLASPARGLAPTHPLPEP